MLVKLVPDAVFSNGMVCREEQVLNMLVKLVTNAVFSNGMDVREKQL